LNLSSSDPDKENNQMRRTFTVVDIVEIMNHWYAGRSVTEVARSLGLDRKTVRRYIDPARSSGIIPGGPPTAEDTWRSYIRDWFPALFEQQRGCYRRSSPLERGCLASPSRVGRGRQRAAQSSVDVEDRRTRRSR
jgi:hypothetical protein